MGSLTLQTDGSKYSDDYAALLNGLKAALRCTPLELTKPFVQHHA